jgi:hypothetical protein
MNKYKTLIIFLAYIFIIITISLLFKYYDEKYYEPSKNNEVQLSSILSKYEGNITDTSNTKSVGIKGSITITPQIQDIKTGNIIQKSQIFINK